MYVWGDWLLGRLGGKHLDPGGYHLISGCLHWWIQSWNRVLGDGNNGRCGLVVGNGFLVANSGKTYLFRPFPVSASLLPSFHKQQHHVFLTPWCSPLSYTQSLTLYWNLHTVLVIFYCYEEITWQRQLIKQSKACLQRQKVSPWPSAGLQSWCWAVAMSLHKIHKLQAEQARIAWYGLLKPQSLPPGTHLL